MGYEYPQGHETMKNLIPIEKNVKISHKIVEQIKGIILSGSLQPHREEEQLALVDLFPLLAVTPPQEWFEDVLNALQTPFVGVQLGGQIHHHLP